MVEDIEEETVLISKKIHMEGISRTKEINIAKTITRRATIKSLNNMMMKNGIMTGLSNTIHKTQLPDGIPMITKITIIQSPIKSQGEINLVIGVAINKVQLVLTEITEGRIETLGEAANHPKTPTTLLTTIPITTPTISPSRRPRLTRTGEEVSEGCRRGEEGSLFKQICWMS